MPKPDHSSKDATASNEIPTDRLNKPVDAEDVIRRGFKKLFKESSEIDEQVDEQFEKIRSRPAGTGKRFRL